ncbi:hypothetical protein V5E97_12150 [Singulisphaera sp. Ch08]|uniref:Secreted protein n=1 Tax=Singulisphaera sp. Ch08 TaxID=3120278 RepID=A0AAU7CNE7_9BACT
MTRWQTWIVVVGVFGLSEPATACGQAVGFFPNVGRFPDGAVLSATPIVSHDRRYVRLGVVPQFTEIEGFSLYQIPAAVSGGGLGNGSGMDAIMSGPVGYAGMNGPTPGPPGHETRFPTRDRRDLSGRGTLRSSSDFEDQVWPEPAASKPMPRAQASKAKQRGRKPALKPAKWGRSSQR